MKHGTNNNELYSSEILIHRVILMHSDSDRYRICGGWEATHVRSWNEFRM